MIFEKYEIPDDIREQINQQNIQNITIDFSSLSMLGLSYYNFRKEIKTDGLMIIHNRLADQALQIFETLCKNQFCIAKINLTLEYENDDILSMQANNTCAFNPRNITGTNRLSKHALGMAIDINPIQNPCLYIGENLTIQPQQGREFLNRKNIRDGMVESQIAGKTVVDVFKENGFVKWGGNWDSPIDWHHFEAEIEI